jgi:hypothetical protein
MQKNYLSFKKARPDDYANDCSRQIENLRMIALLIDLETIGTQTLAGLPTDLKCKHVYN